MSVDIVFGFDVGMRCVCGYVLLILRAAVRR